MRTIKLKFAQKREFTQFLLSPFIYKFLPFVCNPKALFIPFIGEKIPNSIINPKENFSIRGFTLIELMVAIAVSAILLMVAVPNLRTIIQNGRINTQTNDLIGDISLARSEAIKRRLVTGICKSTNGTSCTGGSWSNGRIIFVDRNRDNAWDVNDLVLRFRGPLSTATDTLNANPSLNDPILFGINGSPININAGGFFVFCDDRGATRGKRINLNVVGQAMVWTTAPATCTP